MASRSETSSTLQCRQPPQAQIRPVGASIHGRCLGRDPRLAARGVVGRLGRRRHLPDADKVRIVEENLRVHQQGSATARRYGISCSLLAIWRREYRISAFDEHGTDADFVPLVVENVTRTRPKVPLMPAAMEMIDITLANGLRMPFLVSLDPAHLAARLAVVDPRSWPQAHTHQDRSSGCRWHRTPTTLGFVPAWQSQAIPTAPLRLKSLVQNTLKVLTLCQSLDSSAKHICPTLSSPGAKAIRMLVWLELPKAPP